MWESSVIGHLWQPGTLRSQKWGGSVGHFAGEPACRLVVATAGIPQHGAPAHPAFQPGAHGIGDTNWLANVRMEASAGVWRGRIGRRRKRCAASGAAAGNAACRPAQRGASARAQHIRV